MNRREMFKALIGVAVAAAIPSMPFRWRELTFSEIVAKTLQEHGPELVANVTRHNALFRRLQA